MPSLSDGLRSLLPVCLLISLIGCDSKQEQFTRHLDDAKTFYKRGDLTRAKQAFDSGLAVDPEDISLHFQSAEALSQLGDIKAAAKQYQWILVKDSQHIQARLKLAQLYFLAGELVAAEQMVKAVLTHDAENIEALVLHGNLLSALSNTDAAFIKAEAVLHKNPDNQGAVLLMAALNAKTGKIGMAVESLQDYVAKHANNIPARLALANLYNQLHQLENAERVLVETTQIEPNELLHRQRLASFLINSQRLDQAESVLRAAITDISDQQQPLLLLIDFIIAHRKPELAIAELLPMVDQHPDFYELRFRLAELQLKQQQAGQAEETLQELLNVEPQNSYSTRAKIQLARIYKDSGRSDQAKALVNAVLTAQSDNYDALTLRGELALLDRRVADAITDFRAVLTAQPNTISVLKLLAAAHLLNQDGVMARENIEKVLQLAPGDESVRLDLVNLLLQAGDREQASNQLNALFKANPNSKLGLEALTKIHLAAKQWDKALIAAKQLETLYPQEALGYYLSGLIYQQQGKLDLSNARFEQALQKQPQLTEPLSQWVRNLLTSKQSDKALLKLHDWIKKQPDNFFAHNLLGDVYTLNGKPNEAITAYQQAITLKSSWFVPYRSIARHYLDQKKISEAVVVLKDGLVKVKEPLVLVTDLAALYHLSGDKPKAIALYQEWHKKYPDSLNLTHSYVRYIAEHGESAEALAEVAKLLELLLKTNDSLMLDTAGWVAFRQGNFEQAKQWLEKAIMLNPDLAVSYYHLGMLAVKQGDAGKARTYLQQAIDKKQNFTGLTEAKTQLAELTKAQPK